MNVKGSDTSRSLKRQRRLTWALAIAVFVLFLGTTLRECGVSLVR